jgi:hypothetical protein
VMMDHERRVTFHERACDGEVILSVLSYRRTTTRQEKDSRRTSLFSSSLEAWNFPYSTQSNIRKLESMKHTSKITAFQYLMHCYYWEYSHKNTSNILLWKSEHHFWSSTSRCWRRIKSNFTWRIERLFPSRL